MNDELGSRGWIRFDKVEIDVGGHRLRVDGIDVPLERKAFTVLLLLVRHPGRVFTRQEILDTVWGHAHVTPSVLNRIVTLVRQALGDSAEKHRYLQTVHGVGYRFDLPESASIQPANGATLDDYETTAASTIGSAGDGADGSAKPSRGRAAAWAVALLVLLSLLAFGGWQLWPGRQPASTTLVAPGGQHSIAVLPLENVGGDPEQQFFADGISENLIEVLSKFDGMNVIGRMSSFQFRNSQADSRTIGAKLGVAYLVSGSVQRAGDTVRIHTELVSASDGSTLWAGRYDRPYKDLFALQDEIAMAISNALHTKLVSTRDVTSQGDRPPGGSIDAYKAYLQGLQKGYLGEFDKAVEYQQTAIRLDPGYAAAWAQLAVIWTTLGYAASGDDARDYFHKARSAVDRALALQPDLGLAHGALANLLLAADFDWSTAVSEFRRGVQLAPDNGQNHGGLSRALAATGKLREAIEQRQRFISIEPLLAANYILDSELLIAAGRLDEAEESMHIGAELQHQAVPPYRFMNIAILRGDDKTALAFAGQQPQPQWRAFNLAFVAQDGPDRRAADAALARVMSDRAWAEAQPYQIAQIHALRGEADKTVQWLERAWARHDSGLHRLLYDPFILRFRDTPSLIAFCTNIGLPSPKDSEALSIDQIRAASHQQN
jgi:TolB-like protein/DNA-binding winged helix-turn-helix (wHTH) protein